MENYIKSVSDNLPSSLVLLKAGDDRKHPLCKAWTSKKESDVYNPNWTNYAMLTGEASGVWVLDIDNKGTNLEDMQEWFLDNQFDPTCDSFLVETPSGGWHIYFKYDKRVKNFPKSYKKVNDLQGNGKCVMFIGTSFKKGYIIKDDNIVEYKHYDPYTVLNDAEIQYAPDFIIEAILEEAKGSKTAVKEELPIQPSYSSDNITPETQSICDDDVVEACLTHPTGYDSFRYCSKDEKKRYMHELTRIINTSHIKAYYDWVGVGNMYIYELGDDGFPMFLEYCKRDVQGFESLNKDEYLREAELRKKWNKFPTDGYTGDPKTVASLLKWAKEDNPNEYEKIMKRLNKKNEIAKKEEKIAKKEEKILLNANLLNMAPDSDNFINRFVEDDFTMVKLLRHLDDTVFSTKIEAYEYIRDNLHKVCLLTGLEMLVTKNDNNTIGFYKLKDFPETLIKTEDYDPMDPTKLNKILFNNRNFICRYDKADVYPNNHNCPNNDFNLWTPFYCDTIKEYTEMSEARDIILKHIMIICNNVEESYNYVINWIANMIKYPWQKAPMLLFLAEQGAGKGAFLDFLERLIGSKKFHTSSEPDRDVWGTFNGLMVGKILIHLEELSKKQCKDADDKIKKLTTSGVIDINKKGKDQTQIYSHHKFIISTNKLESVRIERTDRRFFATDCSNELIRNKAYFVNFYKLINDPNVIKTMAVYFQSLTVPEVYLNVKIPMTPLKETLMNLSKDKYQLWLDNYALGKSGQIELRTSECYEKFKKFAEENHIAINEVNMVRFGVNIQRNNNVIKGKHTKYGNQIIIDMDAVNRDQGIELDPEEEQDERGEDEFEDLKTL